MKKSIILAVLAFCAVSFSMANELGAAPVAVLDSTVYDGIGGKNKEVFLYDAKGNLETQINSHWGGTKWEDDGKYEYAYDLKGNITLKAYAYYTSEGWEYSNKEEYAFDDNNNLTLALFSNWNTSKNTWEMYNHEVYTYDVNGNLIQLIKGGWDGTDWINWDKHVYENDAKGNRIKEVYSWWSTADNAYKPGNTKTYAYDTNDRLTVMVESSYYDDAWHDVVKETYAYDEYGNHVKDEFFEVASDEWRPTIKVVREFDSDGNCTILIQSYYNTTKSMYENVQKTEYVYTDGKLTSETSFYWSETKWIADMKSEFGYDVLGNLTKRQDFSWDIVGSIFELNGTNTYYYHYESPSTAICNTVPEATALKSVKVMRNGHVLIIREGKAYDLNGKVVE